MDSEQLYDGKIATLHSTFLPELILHDSNHCWGWPRRMRNRLVPGSLET